MSLFVLHVSGPQHPTLMGGMRELLAAIERGLPVPLLKAKKRTRPLYLGQDYLGDCMLRLIAAEGGPVIPRSDPFLLLECLRLRYLWYYYQAHHPTGREVEDWVLGVGEIEGFPEIPTGFPRATWLFGKIVPKWMLELGYFYTLAFRSEIPPDRREIFLEASLGNMKEFKKNKSKLKKTYMKGIPRRFRP